MEMSIRETGRGTVSMGGGGILGSTEVLIWGVMIWI